MVNEPLTVVAAGTAITATTSFDIDMAGARGILLAVNISAASGTTPTLDIKLQRPEPVSRTFIDLEGASLAQKTTTGSDDLVVYPGVAETANRSVSDHCGRSIRVVLTVGGSSPSFTLSLGATRLA